MRALAAFFALATSGCVAPDQRPAARQAAIVGGELAPADTAVLALAHPGQEILCTGTLISRRLVVTAAHCVAAPLVARLRSPSGAERMLTVSTTELAPGFSGATLANDLAIVVLAEPVSDDVVPIPLAWRAPVPGDPVRLVGFGYDATGPAGDYGQRRERSAAITEVGATTFRYGVGTCEGDSGGPALIRVGGRDELVGVTSTGDAACSLYGINTRVDVLADWIASAAARLDPVSCADDAQDAGGCPVRWRGQALVTSGCAVRGGARRPHWLALVSLLAAASLRRATRSRRGGSHV